MPYNVDKDENIAALQVIWRAVYPHINYIIDADCLVYRNRQIRVFSIDGAALIRLPLTCSSLLIRI